MSGEGSSGEKTDPGAIRHGNFINYYQFHPAEERVRQLPRGVWQRRRDAHPARKYAGLDVGCNAGVRTAQLSGIQNGTTWPSWSETTNGASNFESSYPFSSTGRAPSASGIRILCPCSRNFLHVCAHSFLYLLKLTRFSNYTDRFS